VERAACRAYRGIGPAAGAGDTMYESSHSIPDVLLLLLLVPFFSFFSFDLAIAIDLAIDLAIAPFAVAVAVVPDPVRLVAREGVRDEDEGGRTRETSSVARQRSTDPSNGKKKKERKKKVPFNAVPSDSHSSL
jgi:hypothetical protein